MTLVTTVPVAHEASDGRIVVQAPAATDRLEVSVSGRPTPARLVSTRAEDGRLRITVQISAVARTGADLEVVGYRRSRVVGRAVVDDVHLLGAGAFAQPRRGASIASARAEKEARSIAAGAGGQVGIWTKCLGTARYAQANGDHVAVAASTLKVPILAAALAADSGNPTRAGVFGTYRAAIADSSNDAANRILASVGDGSYATGTARVNALMRRLRMRNSFLDGRYRLSGGPSLKRTSASDLARLADAVYRAADGSGPLARLGVTRHESRVLLGLMAIETYPGLIRAHVRNPVAHKAGWLRAVQNDVALVFGTRGGTCIVGITTEGLSFGDADDLGRQVGERVLPLLAARRPSAPSRPETGGITSSRARTPGGQGSPAPTVTASEGAALWPWFIASVGAFILAAGTVAAYRARRAARYVRAGPSRVPSPADVAARPARRARVLGGHRRRRKST